MQKLNAEMMMVLVGVMVGYHFLPLNLHQLSFYFRKFFILMIPHNINCKNNCIYHFSKASLAVRHVSKVRNVSIFAKKYGAHVRYALFCENTGTVLWHAV